MSRFLQYRGRLWLGAVIVALLATMFGIQPAHAEQVCTVRYYISPIIGAGTDEDSIRPAIYDEVFLGSGNPHPLWQGAGFVYGPTDPATGRPISSWAFVALSGYNLAPFSNDEETGALPDLPLDTPLSEFDNRNLQSLEDVLMQFNIDTSILETAITYYDVIWFIGTTLAGSGFQIPSAFCPG